MVRKKTEGNEEQRRQAAREARRKGEAPSAAKATTGSSKQRTHVDSGAEHEERVEKIHAGKQQSLGPHPRPGSVEDREPASKRH
jgi:hypothetical protein